MKTTIQELIAYLRSLAFTKCHLGMGDIMLTQGHIDELEEKYIEKEKEQIIDACNNGIKYGYTTTGYKYYDEYYLQITNKKEQILNLIRFLRTNDKMGKTVDELYNEFYNQNK